MSVLISGQTEVNGVSGGVLVGRRLKIARKEKVEAKAAEGG